ncbi:hypothetical protein PspKH34_03180 [Parageobacillus sp. KH3-4]|nr:hypothetical protein PspKH34_03180 [Parageobacillus sp. KH3-4]
MDPLETAEEMKQAVLQYTTMNGYKRNKTAVALKNIWLQLLNNKSLLNIGVSTNPNDPFYFLLILLSAGIANDPHNF